jgi:cysteine sulfinate desulfinase/cysteine desulfurase-like protein
MESLIYLDNAATSFPKPDSTHEAVHEFYSKFGVNPGRSGCDLGINAEQMIHGTRRRFSEFFNRSLIESGKTKDPNRLVFTWRRTPRASSTRRKSARRSRKTPSWSS